jgi:hypothetical protein
MSVASRSPHPLHESRRERQPNRVEVRGQTVRVQFRATTDVTLPTSFRIDDVSLR